MDKPATTAELWAKLEVGLLPVLRGTPHLPEPRAGGAVLHATAPRLRPGDKGACMLCVHGHAVLRLPEPSAGTGASPSWCVAQGVEQMKSKRFMKQMLLQVCGRLLPARPAAARAPCTHCCCMGSSAWFVPGQRARSTSSCYACIRTSNPARAPGLRSPARQACVAYAA